MRNIGKIVVIALVALVLLLLLGGVGMMGFGGWRMMGGNGMRWPGMIALLIATALGYTRDREFPAQQVDRTIF